MIVDAHRFPHLVTGKAEKNSGQRFFPRVSQGPIGRRNNRAAEQTLLGASSPGCLADETTFEDWPRAQQEPGLHLEVP